MDHIVYKISLHIKAVRKETIEAGFVEPGLVIKQLNYFFFQKLSIELLKASPHGTLQTKDSHLCFRVKDFRWTVSSNEIMVTDGHVDVCIR